MNYYENEWGERKKIRQGTYDRECVRREDKFTPHTPGTKSKYDLTYHVKDYIKITNSADYLNKKVIKELDKFNVGLHKIDYMHENVENYKKIKKDILKIQASSYSFLNSKKKTMDYFCSRCEEKPIDQIFISDSEENSSDSLYEICEGDLLIRNRIFNPLKSGNESHGLKKKLRAGYKNRYKILY